ncbi:hypothetical protein H2200_012345 [Cladophialophora chaetospira]|uniref:Uncharacterized protein n=1 Tax=Cladophialophora chaetospira TaxID=386627 RepID=A0AA39CCD5_9EURO|nr:hypothetical protein H2200_012345 [Cladophialophora chaetospira]
MADHFEEERPAHDTADYTRKGIYISIGVSLVVALAAIGLSVATFAGQLADTGLAANSIVGELLPLAFNIVVAVLTDILSFAHSVSLRWALYKEDRLHYNSNLRLFTSTKQCASNRWPANLLSATFLITSYTAANAALFVYKREAGEKYISLNAVAFMALGISLIGQIIIALWSLHKSEQWVHSWSANPLNTALAFLNKGESYRVLGRGMMSVHDYHAGIKPGPVQPRKKQGNMIKAYPHVGLLLWIVGLALLLDLTFAGIVCKLTFQQHPDASLAFVQNTNTGPANSYSSSFHFNMPPDWSPYMTQLVMFLMGMMLQACITLTLHCAELLINVHRDECTWRSAYIATGKGAEIDTNPVVSAFSSWSWIALFCIKPVAQWLFGTASLSLGQRGAGDGLVWFNSVPLFVLAGVLVLILAHLSFLALRSPKGPQPATFGHIQTLVNLIDDWGSDIKSRLYWGEKVRHEYGVHVVGTSANRMRVKALDMTQDYW